MFKLFKKKEENDDNKKDWLVIHTFHERYSLETTIHTWCNLTIEELLLNYNITNANMSIIEKNERNNSYLVDFSAHSGIDNKYTYPGLDNKKIQHIHLESIYAIPIENFIKNDGFASYVWGATESKFGLLDIKRE